MEDLDEFIRAKRERTRNRLLTHLTEADCDLLLTNSREIVLQTGAVIVEQGQLLTSIFRIKTGVVDLLRDGAKVGSVGPGWFISDSIIVEDEPSFTSATTFVAFGNVVILEVDIPWALHMFQVDPYLALKFYRTVAAKAASQFIRAMGTVMLATGDGVAPKPINQTQNIEYLHHKKSRKHKMLRKRPDLTYKVYQLYVPHGSATCKIHKEEIEIISQTVGIKHKKSIPFVLIKTVTVTSEDSITIIFGFQEARTIFLKKAAELQEVYGYLMSILSVKQQVGSFVPPSQLTNSAPNSAASTPAPGSPSWTGPQSGRRYTKFDLFSTQGIMQTPFEQDNMSLMREMMSGVVEKLTLKKGATLMTEGTLYQRVWQVVEGTVEVSKGGTPLYNITEGSLFGEATLLHLRPAPVTAMVSSETALIFTLPLYKLQALASSNTALAATIYKQTAKHILAKIESVTTDLV